MMMLGDTSQGMINAYFGPHLLTKYGFTEHKVDQAWIIDRGRSITDKRINDAFEFVKSKGVTFYWGDKKSDSEDFTFEQPKTREFKAFENNLKIADKKSILVLSEPNKNLYLSSRNLQGSKAITVSELTTYDILDAKALVFVESSIDVLEKMF